MNHAERSQALQEAQDRLASLAQEAQTLPMSSGSRRWTYINALEAARAALTAAQFSNWSEEEATGKS